MKRPNITPGPWQDFNMTGEKGYRAIIDNDGRNIAAMSMRLPDAVDANARAIAAVPDLLAALEVFASPDFYPTWNREKARAALTKAGYTF